MRYTDDDIRAALAAAITEAGSLRKAAAHLGFSPSYLSMVMLGQTPPSEYLGEALGYHQDGKRWVARKRKE